MNNMQLVMQMLTGKGLTAEQMVKNICKERNLDVEKVLEETKKRMGEFANLNK